MADTTASITIGAKDATGPAFSAVERSIQKLQLAAATNGKSATEAKLLELSLKGATEQQLKLAESSLKLNEAYNKGAVIGQVLKMGLIAAAAATATSAVISFSTALRDIDAFNDLSDATGASVENISALDRVARETGDSFDTVAATLTKFNAALNKAGEEGRPVTAVLKALGLSAEELKNKDPAEALLDVAKAFQQFERDGNAARAAQILFGKSIQEVAPFLKELSEQTKLVSKISSESAQNAEAFNKQLFNIRANAEDSARSLTNALLPVLTTILKGLQNIPAKLNILGTINELKAADTALRSLEARRDSKFNFAGNLEAEIAKAKARLAAAKKDFAAQDVFPGQPTDDGSFDRVEAARLASKKRKLVIEDDKPPKGPRVKDTAEAEARALLNLDIENIRKANELLVASYNNAEKILEANRAAGLVNERAYYAAKIGFVNLDTAAQEDALTKELARLQAEKLSSAAAIENKKKIVDVEAKLASVRASAVTSVEVLKTQETAALDKIAQSYREAEEAARSYLNTLRLQQDRETAGQGQGRVARARNAGVNQNEDRFTQQRQRLEQDKRNGAFNGREDDFQKELDLIRSSEAQALEIYTNGFDQRLAAQQNWQIGASEAFKNYYDEAGNIAKQTEDAFTSAFNGMEDALVNFVKTGKLDFKSLADSIISNLIRIAVQQSITKQLASALGDSDILGVLLGGLLGGARADGGPVSAGKLYQVNERGPELLETAGKQYLMMGSQGGNVVPNGGAASAGNSVTQNNTFIVQGQVDRRTQEQIAARAAAGAQRALARNY